MVTTLAPVISTVSTTTTGADGKPTTRLIVTTLTSMISTVTTTTTGIDGKPTAVIFTTTFPGQAITTLVTITTSTTQDDHIVVDGTVYTLTNSLGQPTATLTSLPAGVLRPATFITTTVTNSLGQPTATITTDVPISLSTTLLTFYDNGTPVRTQTQYILPPAPRPTYLYPPDNGGSPVPGKVIWVDPLTASAYFAGSFLPVLLATLLAIPIQILNTNLHAMTPFQALTRSGGVPVKDSLLLSSSGGENFLQARWAAVRLAYCHKEPVLLLSDLLLGLVVVLVSLASEGVGMTLEGDCEEGGFQGCYLSLAIVQGPARAAEGLLVAICLGVVGVGVCVGRSRSQWRSGVRSNPRCIAAVAGLLAASDGRVKELILGVDTPTDGKLVPAKGLRDWFGEQRFAMAESGGGIVVVGDPLRRRATFSSGQQRTPSGGLKRQYTNMTTRHKNTVVLEYGFRVLFLAILCGLLSIVVYYGSTQLRRDDLFEHFMDSQTFGVAFLFTGTGVVMDLFWDHFFSRTEMLEPYRRLARPTASTHADLIRPRSSNVFSGLFRAAVHGNVFAGAVASAGVLAKFVPIFLANVPFRLTLTWITFMTCTWISVTILSLMVVVLLVSFLVRWPYLPVDPGTIAGCMYYVCDSRMLADLKAVADLDEGARHRHLRDIGMRYRCGSMVGVSAKRRIGID
ncbi:hypothetical protein B0H66DRAFT_483994 [Apodospora peruviana]|uniref:Uncharacterized protein n=1 Tax=Apodospora peruviana TaxID=516989 RepID=A0AAE0HWB0_9PEZI|nr:hypothetical protein B0H66DRAFT_483994 [Apodospora peruviana]